jgi:predicted DCC family thiol-disulfide oxidoreductase YuxK
MTLPESAADAPALSLIFDSTCPSCSELASLVRERAGDRPLRLISIFSAEARGLLLRHFPDGWDFEPFLVVRDVEGERVLRGPAMLTALTPILGFTGGLRAAKLALEKLVRDRDANRPSAPRAALRPHRMADLDEAERFARRPLLRPLAGPAADVKPSPVVQFFNARAIHLTSATYALPDGGRLTIDQCHDQAPPPDLGTAAEAITIGPLNGHLRTAAGSNLNLALALGDGGWVMLRGIGLDRAALIATAESFNASA